jgi:aarF domain-containing kinase
LYIKFGQQIASLNHVLPAQYAQHLKVLYDEAPAIENDRVDQIFMEEFGKRPNELFKSWNPEPVASASIAQVHRASLEDGTQVAVKVQKHYIAKQMDWDLRTYRFLMFMFEKVFDLPVYWSVDVVEKHLRTELDFVNEAKNAEKAHMHIKENSRLSKNCYIPHVHWKFTSKRVMACEWIDGIKFIDLKDIEKQGFNKKSIMSSMVQLFSDQIFRTGFIHCDPHPGNILIRKHPRRKNDFQLVLLDHGLYTQCEEKFRSSYSLLWVSLFSMDTDMLSKITKSWGIGDMQMFASATLQRPWKPGQILHVGQSYSMKDIYEMQVSAKERVVQFLSDTKLIPQELIFIGRNLNLIRSNNKSMGSPVNRIAIMASTASRNTSHTFSFWKFQFVLIALSLRFYYTIFKSWILRQFGAAYKNFEEQMDENIQQVIYQQYGIKLDMSSFDA